MTAYLVTYRLGRDEQQYAKLYEYFDNAGRATVGTSAHVILSHKSALEIANDLRPYLDSNDMLYVFELTEVWAGFHGPNSESSDPKSVAHWLGKYLAGRNRFIR